MKEASKTTRNIDRKKKVLATTAMLLVAATVLIAVSYAWLVLSIAPEVTGIQTNIASNGALEIVLLNGDTYFNTDKITTTVGGSKTWERNFHWSNLVDLNFEEAGLSEIALLPARLNISASNPTKIKDPTSILSVPVYDDYGVVASVDNDTFFATYSSENKVFAYNPNDPNYGVRAFGTSNSLSLQESAIISAKSVLTSHIKSAKSNAISAMKNNGTGLLAIITTHSGTNVFGSEHLNTVESMVKSLQSSANFIRDSIRQGLIIVAASEIADETKFENAREAITTLDLNLIVDQFEATDVTLPSEFETLIANYDKIANTLVAAKGEINLLRTQETYSWDNIKGVLDYVINLDSGLYFNGVSFDKVSSDQILNATEKKLTLAKGSGAFADIADFVDDYNTTIETIAGNINVEVLTAVDPAYLTALNDAVKDMEAVGGDAATGAIALDNLYGYAIDLGFRTNATISDLLLQTDAIQRIYEDSISTSTMGNGSCMIFDTNASNISETDLLRLADAVRVAFVTNDGTILGIAKLNISNYKKTDSTTIEIPLYLYDYTVSKDGALIMGERNKEDSTLTPLEKNVTKAVSAIVWLDGDRVDNTMVAAEEKHSFTGTLNLQFASSADLIPAGMEYLKDLSTNKEELDNKINAESEIAKIYNAGQKNYTSKTWNDFVIAYNRAQSVANDATATGTMINMADKNLTLAKEALEVISKDSLQEEIKAIREKVGKTTDIARIVIESDGRYYATSTYTEEQLTKNKGFIYLVDHTKNLTSYGDGVDTEIYTINSWMNLASALYEAETLALDPNATEKEIDDAITALDTANKALSRRMYYIPYVLEGEHGTTLYYKSFAAEGQDDIDTYGIWYDANFNHVIDEFTIIQLDGKAKAMTDTATIDTREHYPYDYSGVVYGMSVTLNKVFNNDSIIAIRWNLPDIFVNQITDEQKVTITALRNEAAEHLKDDNNTLYKEEIQGLLAANTNDMTYEQAELWVLTMEHYLVRSATDFQQRPADTDPMTFNQRVLLTKSIAVARSIETYFENAVLQAVVTDAESLLNNDKATVAGARACAESLNNEIKAAGGKIVTEADIIEYTIPSKIERIALIYTTNNPHTHVSLAEGAHGKGEIIATVLTENGVLITVKKNASVYHPCEGAEITGATTIKIGDTDILIPELLPNTVNNLVEEEIKSVQWSSSNSNSLNVISYENRADCTIMGAKAGTATVTAYVTTVQGNTYKATITITVEE